MSRYASGFDAARVSATDAARVIADAAAIAKMAATVKGLAAARVADTDVWRAEGDRTAAHHLARTTGSTVGAAADSINAARRLDQLPATAAAARRGELSAPQVAAIADAASADPSAETRLVGQARRSSLQELRDDCARAKATATADAEARRKRIHARRSLRHYTDSEGAWHLHVRNNPEVGAQIMAVIDRLRDRQFAAARREGRREPSEAYAADALTALARDGAAQAADPVATTGGSDQAAEAGTSRRSTEETANGAADATDSPPETATAQPRERTATGAKVIVRVDLDALLRGYPMSGELAELVGFGPVAVSVIRDLIETGDPFLTAVATTGADVVGVAHLGRRPTAHQQTALEWLYPTCAVEGCSAVARLEMDHREDWATTRVTLFSLIDRLCPHHHQLKTRGNWSLVEGRGKRAFVPPADARHPRHALPVEGPPAAVPTGPP
ncbi:MAG: DUF222 domain-containing protein [Acidimicrobiales bacterium]